jgi:DNA-binding transcriptional ArsR family regulator
VATAARANIDLQRELLHGLSDRSRLELLNALLGQELQVRDRRGLSQPNASKHLTCLWGCGLVPREKRGSVCGAGGGPVAQPGLDLERLVFNWSAEQVKTWGPRAPSPQSKSTRPSTPPTVTVANGRCRRRGLRAYRGRLGWRGPLGPRSRAALSPLAGPARSSSPPSHRGSRTPAGALRSAVGVPSRFRGTDSWHNAVETAVSVYRRRDRASRRMVARDPSPSAGS